MRILTTHCQIHPESLGIRNLGSLLYLKINKNLKRTGEILQTPVGMPMVALGRAIDGKGEIIIFVKAS